MPQYGALVYLKTPADPEALTPDYLESIARYPDDCKELKAKVLGGSYFAGQRGFAFESSASGMSILGDTVQSGPLVESDLATAAFFVLSAASLEVAVEAARLHPAAREGGIEVRALVPEPR